MLIDYNTVIGSIESNGHFVRRYIDSQFKCGRVTIDQLFFKSCDGCHVLKDKNLFLLKVE